MPNNDWEKAAVTDKIRAIFAQQRRDEAQLESEKVEHHIRLTQSFIQNAIGTITQIWRKNGSTYLVMPDEEIVRGSLKGLGYRSGRRKDNPMQVVDGMILVEARDFFARVKRHLGPDAAQKIAATIGLREEGLSSQKAL